MRESGISETGMSHTIMLVYAGHGLVAEIPRELAMTNCSVPIVAAYDKTDTKFKYSCLPETFIKKKLLGLKSDEIDKKTAVHLLCKLINSDKLSDLLEWMRVNKKKPSNIAFVDACFKPYNVQKLSPLVDFGKITLRDQKISHKAAWISNIIIKKIILPYCKVYNTVYLGTIYLNFLNKLSEFKCMAALDQSIINDKLPERIKTSDKKQFVAVISMFDHWSALYIDMDTKIGYHYNSQGYIQTDQFTDAFKMYSYEKKTVPIHSEKYEVPKSQIVMVDYLIRVIDQLKLKKMYINHEQAQLQDGECGMFSLVFLVLTLLNKNSPNFPDLVYSTSKFWGDLRHREFRDIFFTDSSSFKVVHSIPPIVKDTEASLIKLCEIIKTQAVKLSLTNSLQSAVVDLLRTIQKEIPQAGGLDKLMLKN